MPMPTQAVWVVGKNRAARSPPWPHVPPPCRPGLPGAPARIFAAFRRTCASFPPRPSHYSLRPAKHYRDATVGSYSSRCRTQGSVCDPARTRTRGAVRRAAPERKLSPLAVLPGRPLLMISGDLARNEAAAASLISAARHLPLTPRPCLNALLLRFVCSNPIGRKT